LDIVDAFRHYVLHWTPDRAIWVGGHSFLWDARCAGIYTGVAVTLFWLLLYFPRNRTLPSFPVLAVHALLCLPFALDVLSIAAGWRHPINDVRFATGILVGSGLCLALYPAFVTITLAQIALNCSPRLDSRYALLLLGLAVAFALRYMNYPAVWYFLTGLMILGFCAVVGLLLTNLVVISLGSLLSRRSGR
jgi:uncharacterized membrane protein